MCSPPASQGLASGLLPRARSRRRGTRRAADIRQWSWPRRRSQGPRLRRRRCRLALIRSSLLRPGSCLSRTMARSGHGAQRRSGPPGCDASAARASDPWLRHRAPRFDRISTGLWEGGDANHERREAHEGEGRRPRPRNLRGRDVGCARRSSCRRFGPVRSKRFSPTPTASNASICCSISADGGTVRLTA
jgi:hypothetical protein